MIFPWSLNIKLVKLPKITIFIILSCFLVHYFFQDNNQFNKGLFIETELESNYYGFKKNLENEYLEKFNPYFDSSEKIESIDLNDGNGFFRNLAILINKSRSEKTLSLKRDRLKFEELVSKNDPALESLPSFESFNKAKEKIDKLINEHYKNSNYLNRENKSLRNSIISQFSHGSWFHLFSNMFLLFIVGVFVEARLGAIKYLTCYLLSGTGALYLYVLVLNDDFNQIVGASANVFGIIGAYLVLFYKHKVKVLVWYLKGRFIFLPVIVYIPLIYVLGELLTFLGSKNSYIAHEAHLLGLTLGVITVFGFKKRDHISYPSIQPEEEKLKKTILNTKMSFNKRLKNAITLIKINPYQDEAVKFLKSIDEFSTVYYDNYEPDQKFVKNLSFNLNLILKKSLKDENFRIVNGYLTHFQAFISHKDTFKDLGSKELRKIADGLFLLENYNEAKLIYKYHVKKYPNISRRINLSHTIQEIEYYELQIKIKHKLEDENLWKMKHQLKNQPYPTLN